MAELFQKTGANTVTSSKGYAVEVSLGGGVLYSDGEGQVHIDSEWLVKPHRILLYKRGLDAVPDRRLQDVFSNVARALEYMGHPTEVWPDE